MLTRLRSFVCMYLRYQDTMDPLHDMKKAFIVGLAVSITSFLLIAIGIAMAIKKMVNHFTKKDTPDEVPKELQGHAATAAKNSDTLTPHAADGNDPTTWKPATVRDPDTGELVQRMNEDGLAMTRHPESVNGELNVVEEPTKGYLEACDRDGFIPNEESLSPGRKNFPVEELSGKKPKVFEYNGMTPIAELDTGEMCYLGREAPHEGSGIGIRTIEK